MARNVGSDRIEIDASFKIMERSDGSYTLEMDDVEIWVNDKKHRYNVFYVTEWRAVCVSVTIPCGDGSYRTLKMQKDDDQRDGFSNEAVHRIAGHITVTPSDGSGDFKLPVEVTFSDPVKNRKQQKRPGVFTLVFRSLLSCFNQKILD